MPTPTFSFRISGLDNSMCCDTNENLVDSSRQRDWKSVIHQHVLEPDVLGIEYGPLNERRS